MIKFIQLLRTLPGISQLFTKIDDHLKKVNSNLSIKNGETSINAFKTLRAGVGKSDGGEKEKKFEFDPKEYKRVFNNLKETIENKNQDIRDANIVLTVGLYSKDKRNLFEDSGFQDSSSAKENEETIKNEYVNWTMTSNAINFDINENILFIDNKTNYKKMGYQTILDSIKNIKENSTVSSIIIRIPASMLKRNNKLLDQEKKDIVQSIVDSYYRILQFTLKNFDYKIPAYVVFTEVEEIYGFQEFLSILSPEEKNQFFGWSNPHRIDEIYTETTGKEFLEDFVKTISSFLSVKMVDRIDEEKMKKIMLFKNELLYFIGKIKNIFDYSFINSSVGSNSIFRGFYICGYDEANTDTIPMGAETYINALSKNLESGSAENIPSGKKSLVFFRSLFERKITKEFLINLPNSTLIKKNRNHKFISTTFLSMAVVIFPILFTIFYQNSKNSIGNFEIMLQKFEEPLLKKGNDKRSNTINEKLNLTNLSNIYKALDDKRYIKISSQLSPLTLTSGFDKKLDHFLKKMLITFAVEPAENLIQQKINTVSDVNYNANYKYSVEETYQKLSTYTADINELEKLINDYNSMENGININKLNVLLQNVLEVDLTDDFPKNDLTITGIKPYFSRIIVSNLVKKFSDKYELLLNKLSKSIQEDYIINDLSTKIIEDIDEPNKDMVINDYYEFISNISQNLQLIGKKIDLYSTTNQVVTSSGSEIKIGNINLLSENNILIDNKKSANIEAKIKEAINIRNQSLLNYKSIVLGPLFLQKDPKSPIQLSPNFSKLKNMLSDLEQLKFFSSLGETDNIFEADFSQENFDWNLTNVDAINKEISSYTKYVTENLKQFPDSIQQILKDTIILGVNNVIVKQLNIRLENSDKNSSIEKDILSMNKKSDDILRIVKFISTSNRPDIYNSLLDKTLNKTLNYLSYLKKYSEKNIQYLPKNSTLDWWDGVSPPAYEAYNMFDKRELSDYVSSQNIAFLNLLKDYAQPLINITSELGRGTNYTNNASYIFWNQISEVLLIKEKNAPLLALNDTILSTLTTINSENCLKIISEKPKDNYKNDYFSETNRQIVTSLNKQCKTLSENKFAAEYNKIASIFNEKIAGKFPFVSDYDMDSSEEIDENILRDFLIQFNNFANNDALFKSNPVLVNNSWRKPMNFITKMKNVSKLFWPLLVNDKSLTQNAFEVMLDFKSLKQYESNTFALLERRISIGGKRASNLSRDQTITWQPFDEIALDLRWAKDYTQAPVDIANAPGSKYSLNLNNKEVSYLIKDKWSLIYLARKFALNKKEFFYSPELLFKIPVKTTKLTEDDSEPSMQRIANVIIKMNFYDKSKRSFVSVPLFPEQADYVNSSLKLGKTTAQLGRSMGGI